MIPPGMPTTVSVPVVDNEGRYTGDSERQAYSTLTPGILIDLLDFDADDELWRIFHERSGATILWADDPEQAQSIAAALAEIADWTASADELQQALGLHAPAVRRIARLFDADTSPAPRVTDPSLLAR